MFMTDSRMTTSVPDTTYTRSTAEEETPGYRSLPVSDFPSVEEITLTSTLSPSSLSVTTRNLRSSYRRISFHVDSTVDFSTFDRWTRHITQLLHNTTWMCHKFWNFLWKIVLMRSKGRKELSTFDRSHPRVKTIMDCFYPSHSLTTEKPPPYIRDRVVETWGEHRLVVG